MNKVDAFEVLRDRLEIIAVASSVVAPVEIVKLVRKLGSRRSELPSEDWQGVSSFIVRRHQSWDAERNLWADEAKK